MATDPQLATSHAAAGIDGPRITAIETAIPEHIMPGLMLLRIHTDAGDTVIGHGETYYAPHAVAAMIHDWMARRLIDGDAMAVESHWRFLYERTTSFGTRGAELRAISAIDLALWDVLGQVTGQPIWRLLGGPVRDGITLYNSCGGPSYGGSRQDGAVNHGRPGHGDIGRPGPLEDNYNSNFNPGDLAEELIAEGYTAMKLWTLDRAAHARGGLHISWADLKDALKPFHEIRKRVGDRIELCLDGHALFHLPAALRIAEAMRDIQPLWLEDVLRMDSIDTLADFRDKAGVPIAASEMLLSRTDYVQLLERRAADYVMIDPTWVGGISETHRVAHLAQAYNLPVLMHDCTGPLTTLAGIQVAGAVTNVAFQETVRAHIRTLYDRLIDTNLVVDAGRAMLPTRPGIGARWLDELFDPSLPHHRMTRR